MRAIINFVWLCIFLLGGGLHLHADTHTNTICDIPAFDFIKKQQVKVKTYEPGNVLIEEADTDIDEEFHHSDDLNKGSHKIFPVKYSFSDHWCLPFSDIVIYKDFLKQIETFALSCGDSNPIYLRIGVLRI